MREADGLRVLMAYATAEKAKLTVSGITVGVTMRPAGAPSRIRNEQPPAPSLYSKRR